MALSGIFEISNPKVIPIYTPICPCEYKDMCYICLYMHISRHIHQYLCLHKKHNRRL